MNLEIFGTADKRCKHAPPCHSQSSFCQDSGWTAHGMCLLLCTLRRADRSQTFAKIPVEGTWNAPTTFNFFGSDKWVLLLNSISRVPVASGFPFWCLKVEKVHFTKKNLKIAQSDGKNIKGFLPSLEIKFCCWKIL